MYRIEILVDGEWKKASEHSQECDRDAQYQRMLDGGTPAEELRFS